MTFLIGASIVLGALALGAGFLWACHEVGQWLDLAAVEVLVAVMLLGLALYTFIYTSLAVGRAVTR